MIKGTVKFFNNAKGFGFITPDDGSKDVFLPSAAITASGTAPLKAGQRVSFEHEPDVKGPKVVRLKLLDEKPAVIPESRESRPTDIALYCDPDLAESTEALAALQAAGHEPRLINYMVEAIPFDELKRLSLLLAETDQNLVRRYDPLFLELQLDDRFIGEIEFWTAIAEHPALINGPLLVEGNKVRICKSARDVRSFLGNDGTAEIKRRPRGISPRIAAMMKGLAPPPSPEVEEISAEIPAKAGVTHTKARSGLLPRKLATKKAAPVTKKAAPRLPVKTKARAVKKKKK